jgi:hypothetical protein
MPVGEHAASGHRANELLTELGGTAVHLSGVVDAATANTLISAYSEDRLRPHRPVHLG